MQNATCKAGSLFSNVMSFDIEHLSINLNSWFDKSSKHKNVNILNYKSEYMEYSEVIKFVSSLAFT